MFDLRSLEHSTIIYEPSEKNEKCIYIPSFYDVNCLAYVLSSLKSWEHESDDRTADYVVRSSIVEVSW